MAAATFKTPEVALDPAEADQLAKALADLEAQYPTQIDPRVMAWLNFAGVAGLIVAPRVFAYRMRAAQERQQRRQNRPETPPAPITSMEALSSQVADFPPFSTGKP